MSAIPLGIPARVAAPKVGRFLDLIRSFPSQAALALGTRGVAWATAAGVVGLLCCAVSIAVVALSLRATDANLQRYRAAESLEFIQSTRQLTQTLHLMTYGQREPAEVEGQLRQSWARYEKALTAACGTPGDPSSGGARRRPLCTAGMAMHDLLAPEVAAFDPPRRLMDRAAMAGAVALLGQFNAATDTVAHKIDDLIGKLVGDYAMALLVLTVSTAGFVSAGLVLILLVGRASMEHHRQWQAADEARDLLKETIDCLPAGVVVYDQQERLVMFNSAAVPATPLFKRPGVIGITYPELARETAKLSGEFGAPLENTAEEWIERFRSKGNRTMRQVVGGRWFEWSEKLTPSGRTVGLRVDVTDLKNRELEIQHARDLLQETIDALPAGVVLYDEDERLVMFNEAAGVISPALALPGAIGRTFEELAQENARYLDSAYQNPAAVAAAIDRFRLKGKQGQRHAVNGRWYDFSERSTRHGRTVGLRVDVTDLKTKELEIERARAEYQSLVDSLSDMVYALDAKGNFTFASAATAELLGVPAEKIVGRAFADFLLPEDLGWAKAIARAHLKSSDEGVRQIDLRMKRADDAIRHMEFRFRRPPGGEGGVAAAIGVMRDVTERVELAGRLERQMAEAERARAEYQSLVDSLSDMVFKIDAKSAVITFASAGSLPLFGLRPSEIMGTRAFDHIVADDLEYAMATAKAELTGPDMDVRQMQFRIRTASGSERHVEARFRRMRDENGPTVVAGVIRDVTERVEIAERLKRQMAEIEHGRAEYQALLDSLDDVVVRVDPRTVRITFANAAAKDQWSLELVGADAFGHVAPEDRERLGAALRESLAGPRTRLLQFQYRIVTAGGEVRHVETHFRKMRDAAGKSLVVGIVRDIEARVQLERRLAAEMTRLRSIVESSGALVMLTDRDLRVVVVNREFLNIYGMTEDQLVGRSVRDTVGTSLDPEAHRRWLEGREIGPVRYTRRVVDAAGRQRVFSVTASPIVDSQGVMRQIAFLGVDDTERLETEQALFAAERLSTVGEMAATVAHEISQPLQVIGIACGSAKEELDDAAERGGTANVDFVGAKLTRIGQQVERASRIVGDLRAFVRGTSAGEAAAPFDVADAIRGAVDLTAHGLKERHTTLSQAFGRDLPAVVGHIGRLEQVLVNLINNARDAGGRSIAIAAEAVQQDGRPAVRIAVEDSGPGIAPDVLPRLFATFITTKTRGTGTGIGLRICRRIVEEMGGSISAVNRAEGGARFEVLLPATE